MRNHHRVLGRRGMCLVFIHGENIDGRSCKRMMADKGIRHPAYAQPTVRIHVYHKPFPDPSGLCSCSQHCLIRANCL